MKYDESGSKLALKWQLITSLSRIYQNLSPYSTLDPSLILTCRNHEKKANQLFLSCKFHVSNLIIPKNFGKALSYIVSPKLVL